MKNILILNLSRLRITKGDSSNEKKTGKYKSDEGTIYGINTNDAPAKYIIKKLMSEGKKLDRIICIKTAEAGSAYEKYTEMIHEFCDGIQCRSPEIIPVSGSYEGTDMGPVVKNVLDNIKKDDRIYLDTTGGARNSSYLLMFITRFLEYEGIKLEKAVYSLYNEGSENNQITDVTNLYSMFDLINAANTFTSFGNADELARIFKGTENEQIKEVIEVLREFSDSVTLCQTNLSDVLERLNKSLISVSEQTDLSDTGEILFCRIVDVIKNKFNISDDKPEIDYPDIIRWCIENNLVQQAVTIYNEKIPEYLYRKGYFTASEDVYNFYKKNHGSFSMEYEMYYQGLAHTVNEAHVMKTVERIMKNVSLTDLVTKAPSFNEAALNNDLRRLIQRDNTIRLQKDMTLLFKVKKALFSSSGSRLDVKTVERNFNSNPELKKLKAAAQISSNTFTKYLKALKCRNDIQVLLFSRSSSMEYVLSNFEEMIENNDDFKISEKITSSQMKEILCDSVYVKKWIRNVINHASEESEANEELEQYFKSQGYNVSGSLGVSEIKDIITNALNKLVL